MRIAVLSSGRTHVGWSDFLTGAEWSEHCDWMFDPTKGKCMDETVNERAKALGGRFVRSCFEHGPGYVFDGDSPHSLEFKVKKLYPQLI